MHTHTHAHTHTLHTHTHTHIHIHIHTHTHTLTEEKYIVLESVMYPGQHVGFLPDGVVKAPKETHTGLHARFVPVVLEAVSRCTQRLHLLYM